MGLLFNPRPTFHQLGVVERVLNRHLRAGTLNQVLKQLEFANRSISFFFTTKTMDDALITMFKWTGAVEFYPNLTATSIDSIPNTDSPFGSSYVLSVGYIIVLFVTIPLGYYNLDDNIYVQVGKEPLPKQ